MPTARRSPKRGTSTGRSCRTRRARFGWRDVELRRPPRSEDELYDLWQTRQLAQRLGLTRRSGKKLTFTAKGRSLLGDPESLWRAVAHAIVPNHPFGRATGEVVLALLANGDSVGYDELKTAVAEVIGEESWREKRTGEPADEPLISSSMHETSNLLRALDLLSIGGHWRDRRTNSPRSAGPRRTKRCVTRRPGPDRARSIDDGYPPTGRHRPGWHAH